MFELLIIIGIVCYLCNPKKDTDSNETATYKNRIDICLDNINLRKIW